LVLRHKHLGSDDLALHDREHERAGGRIGLHQTADINIALGDNAFKRGDDALIVGENTKPAPPNCGPLAGLPDAICARHVAPDAMAAIAPAIVQR
jgi:hypothetical protein